uniref:Malate dehydrogenase n=1 Tax=Nucella lapillus TaxID=51631 RepID=Q9GQB5_NUCLP|nr:cytosolic malate dehydrogenase precursor [Nucella lapillus]
MAVKVCITGAAGQIAYSLIPSVAKGEVFGAKQPVIMTLLDIPPMMKVLEGVKMEMVDLALPLLQEVIVTDDPLVAFDNVDAAFLVGAMPRKEGMERKDLLAANVKIFQAQGDALEKKAKKDVKVLVVGNPANTNAAICSKNAKSISPANFSCLTRLDQNRAQAQIAEKLKVPVPTVKNVIIWGNHSSTQFPDSRFAIVEKGAEKVPITTVNNDPAFAEYLKTDFIKSVQQRGASVIKARGLSSAMSAANASVDHMRDWWQGTKDRWVSMGVFSNGEYGIPAGLMYSFPVTVANKKVTIVEGLDINDFAREKMDLTAKELKDEKAMADSALEQKK